MCEVGAGILLQCDGMRSVNVCLISSVFNFSELNETTVLMNLKKRYDQELVYVCLLSNIQIE